MSQVLSKLFLRTYNSHSYSFLPLTMLPGIIISIGVRSQNFRGGRGGGGGGLSFLSRKIWPKIFFYDNPPPICISSNSTFLILLSLMQPHVLALILGLYLTSAHCTHELYSSVLLPNFFQVCPNFPSFARNPPPPPPSLLL